MGFDLDPALENTEESYDTLIVGAGVNGTLAANELLDAGYSADDLAVADPKGYGDNFLDQAEQIGMESMRSGYENHVESSDENDLLDYARRNGRESEISEDGRPSINLFEDHWDYVVEDNDLDELLYRDAVEGIQRNGESYEVEIGGETVSAENIVLATGKGGLNTPDYADELPEEAEAYHAYEDDFSVREAAEFDGKTYVIGGGITAGQVASSLHEYGSDVEMLSRSGVKPPADVEADEEWQEWDTIRSELEGLDLESRKEKIEEERYDGRMPRYIPDKITEYGIAEEGEIENVDYGVNGIQVELSNGRSEEEVQLVFATGFEPAYESQLYQDLVEDLGLKTGYEDMPVMDDDTLEWQTEPGFGSDIYLMGELAEGSLGPYAGNIAGGQIAAEQLAETLGYPEQEIELDYTENFGEEPIKAI